MDIPHHHRQGSNMTVKRAEIERREVPGYPGVYALASGDLPEVPLTLRDDGRLEVTLFSPDGAPRTFLRAAVVVAAFTGKRPEDVSHVKHLNGYLTLDSISNLDLSDRDETDDQVQTVRLYDGRNYTEYPAEYAPPAPVIFEQDKPKKRSVWDS
ncbi:hypothetical protein ACEZCY_30905 [Streptacidiphilus sp. N1-12]|uniref:Uncharacterized protein n=2 Tax=Streptacidiphilus alkalitolerans TaxID=3342712 RepID=A0ABV6WPS3_9ACTN